MGYRQMSLMTKDRKGNPYIVESSTFDGESELVLTAPPEPLEEIEDILDLFAAEYVEE
jgi:hypothetical protein